MVVLLPVCIFMASNVNAIGSGEAAKTATQFLQAYQSKEWVKFAKFIPGSDAQILESDESMTSGWRWQAASNWNGAISGVRYSTYDAANGAKGHTAYAKFGESGDECFIVTMGLGDGKWYVEDIHSPDCSEFYSYSRTSEVLTTTMHEVKNRAGNEKKVDNEPEKAFVQTRKDTYQQYITAYNKLTQLLSEGKGDTPQAQVAYKAYQLEKEKYEISLKENETKNNKLEEKSNKSKVDTKFGNITYSVQEASRSDGSQLRNQAKDSYSYDLDGDNRMEEVLIIPSGKNQQGQFFSLTVLNETGGILWSGPKELNSDNPLVFGEWHFGISMPELIGDIDGNGAINLVAPAPQSDMAPTKFRVLSWTKGAFKAISVSSLMEKLAGSGKFSWTSGAQSHGVWVSSFQSINSLGEVTVEITDYQGGADVKMRRAELRKNTSGFKIKRWIDGNNKDMQSANSNTYRALLSREDHVNSRGVALTDVISIIRQDRANYHLKRII